ncbi:MAG: carboxymuconolactone decarboxylase family protein [Haloechinothrix sp.]
MALSKMMRSLVERAFDRIDAPPRPQGPSWLVDAWEQVDREFVTAPPLTLHLPVPALFAAAWAATRESLLAGPADRVAREVIAAAVSTLNDCPYCVDSHAASTSALGHDGVAKALRAGSAAQIVNDQLRAAAAWAGATRSPGDPLLANPPFAPEDKPYAVGTALTFHYLNRMVCAFLKPAPAKVPSFIDQRGFMTRVLGRFPGRLLGIANLEPGASLQFCTSAPTVPALTSLEKAPQLAAAWSALVAAADSAGEAVLSDRTRTVIFDTIESWTGADPGLGSDWMRRAVASLPEDEHAPATFSLVCALAPYRVEDRLVDAVRTTHPADADVVAIAAWASVRAALRIGTWISTPDVVAPRSRLATRPPPVATNPCGWWD